MTRAHVSTTWKAVAVGALALLVAPFARAAYPAAKDNARLQHDVDEALGLHWTVRTSGGSIVATRTPRELPAADLPSRLERNVQFLHRAEPAMTVDYANGNVHLAGSSDDCDRVADLAQRFASLRGVNGVVIDTRCDPAK